MINFFRDSSKLIKLRYKIHKINRFYDGKLRAAERAKKSYEECEAIAQEWYYEKSDFVKEVEHIASSRIQSRAQNLDLPLPEWDDRDMWDDDRRQHLSAQGRREVSRAIRKEMKERLDVYIPVVTAFTGLIGAIIGLFSILKR
jgi:hypothetical protein